MYVDTVCSRHFYFTLSRAADALIEPRAFRGVYGWVNEFRTTGDFAMRAIAPLSLQPCSWCLPSSSLNRNNRTCWCSLSLSLYLSLPLFLSLSFARARVRARRSIRVYQRSRVVYSVRILWKDKVQHINIWQRGIAWYKHVSHISHLMAKIRILMPSLANLFAGNGVYAQI